MVSMPTDILRSDYKFPPKIYVIGSGPSAPDNVWLIPKDSFVIACNRAIEIPDLYSTIWLVHDPNIQKNAWFNERMSRLVSDGHKVNLQK
jgi:hypothetical protein